MPCSVADVTTVNSEVLRALGIEPPKALAAATIPLWRSSEKTKYHWAGPGADCQHLPHQQRYGRDRRVEQPVTVEESVLDFPMRAEQLCGHCAHSFSLSEPVDAAVVVLAELARARDWVAAGRSGVGEGWSWLQFARWKARQPLVDGRWHALVSVLRGKAWSSTVMAVHANGTCVFTPSALLDPVVVPATFIVGIGVTR